MANHNALEVLTAAQLDSVSGGRWWTDMHGTCGWVLEFGPNITISGTYYPNGNSYTNVSAGGQGIGHNNTYNHT